MSKRVRISNERVNSYGFRVLTSGIDLEQYRRNPVLLYMHERGNVIGIVKDLQVGNGEVTGELVFDEASELSIRCKKQYEVGSLRMVSIGIDPKETSDAKELLLESQTRPTVTKCKLVEVSLVDIGANDDAIVMKTDGTTIELEKDGSCLLPLLAANKQHTEQNLAANKQHTGQDLAANKQHTEPIINPIKETEMDLKAIALKLGLPETADEAAILNKIAVLQKDAAAATTLKAENDKLTLASITTLVDTAVADKKITVENREHFIGLGKSVGADELKKTLEAMSPRVKLSDVVKPVGEAPGTVAGGYTKLSEVPAESLVKMRQDDKETYRRLYKAEYGCDCDI